MSQQDDTNELHLLAQSCYVLLNCLDSVRKQAEQPGDADLRKATRHVALALDCLTVDERGVAPWLDEACTLIADNQANALFNLTAEELAVLSGEQSNAATADLEPEPSTPPADDSERVLPRRGLQGDTRSMSISDLLSWLSLQERDGVLHLQIPGELVTIYLEGGNLVHAESDNSPASSRVGEILVEQGTLTRAQLDDVVARLAATGQCFGALVRDEDLVAEADLHRALKEQINRLFRRVFDAELAQFSLVEDLPRSDDGKLNLSTMSLLLDAARLSDEALRNADDPAPAGED